MEIRFPQGFIAEDVKQEFVNLFEKWGPFFTRQVDRVSVEVTDMKVIASISVLPRYRQANMSISAEYLTLSPEQREEVFVHELAHMILAPIQIAVAPVYGQLEKQAKEIAEEWLDEALEGATEDLARAMMLAFGECDCGDDELDIVVCCENCPDARCENCPKGDD